MPSQEKIAAIILAAIFVIYLGQAVFNFRFSLRREKGVFAEGAVGHIKNLNPLFVDFNDVDRDVSQLVFSGLIRYDPKKKNFFPDLAEKWDRSSNGLVYKFTLRSNGVWHDGQPLTADDVIFTFKGVIQNPAFRNPILKNAFENVKLEKIQPNVIQFTLPKPNSYFISVMTVGILPQHLLSEVPVNTMDKSSFAQHPVGSGPYRVKSVKFDTQGDVIDLEAFENYYGQKPAISKIRFYTLPDEQTLVKERNALHAIAKLNADSGEKIAVENRFALYDYTLNQFSALYFNTDKPFLKEKSVRQALSKALDKAALMGKKEQRVDSLDLQDHGSDPLFAFDLPGAKKMMADAGLKSGEKISLNLLTDTKTPDGTTEKIKNMWGALGIEVKVTKADKDFYQSVVDRNYDVLLMRTNMGYNRDVYPLFHSSQIGSQGLNFSNFRSFRTDGITEAIRKEQNPPDKEKLLAELSKVISDEVPVVFLSTPVYSYALDKRMQPFPASSMDFHSDRFLIIPYLTFQTI